MQFNKTTRKMMLIGTIIVVAAMHFAVGTQTHSLHIVHVTLGLLSLLPILAGAVWFGFRGGVLAAGAVSILYYAHMRLNWPDQPMENINQVATIVTYLFVGSVAGLLVRMQERERLRRMQVEQDAQRQAVVQGLASLAKALGSRDDYTLRHSENVARLAVELGGRRRLSPARIESLRLAALVHDIGKIAVRDDVLLKPGRLSAEETSAVRRHPAIAAEILSAIRGTEEIAAIVLAHHEKLNGTGYPMGLKEQQISLESKILSVADIFCALTESRPYKSVLMDARQALSIIDPMAGIELDAQTVHALRQIVAESWPDGIVTNGSKTCSTSSRMDCGVKHGLNDRHRFQLSWGAQTISNEKLRSPCGA